MFNPLDWWRTKTRSPQQEQARRAPILAILRSGQDLFRAGRYADALQAFERTRDQARRAQINDLAARAMGNVGGCQFALHQYQAALQTFLNAVRAAEKAGDLSAAAVFNANIASLYSEMGELDAAAEWTESSLNRLSDKDRDENEAKLLIQLGTLRARQERWNQANALFARGLDAADRKGDVELYANGWNRIGEEHLKQHDPDAAEGPLLEAYRLRRLNRLPLDSTYRSLGLLRLEQGDLHSAGILLDRAVELSARAAGPIPTWDVFHQRGRVRLAEGRLTEALDDLRIAQRLARGWRWNAPPDDAARAGAESWLAKVHSSLIEAANRLYLQSHDPALLRESFEAAEENRGNSLRALVARRAADPTNIPAPYWEALARLQRAEIQALRTPSAASLDAAARSRAELARLELELPGVAPQPLPGLLDSARAALDGDSVLLTFQTGDANSWMWSLDRDGLALYKLPGRAEIASQVERVSTAIRSGGDAASVSEQLSGTLFGSLDAHARHKKNWLIALDNGLFEVPLAALTENGRYLIEQHAIQTIPSAGLWLDAARRSRSRRSGLFVGVGDAIYNSADPRLPGGVAPAPGALLLPRLVASAGEVEACAGLWGGDRVVLRGANASRENLQRELARDPAVVHLATHVLESGDAQPHGLIALSLTPRLENQLLPPQEIATWRTAAELVVLSGCHSAGAPATPGTGLLGLTRAWLAAGAGNVIASSWATPDESGSLFCALYRNLSANPNTGPSAALRAAQLEMIRADDWRAHPRYWGAYFAVGTR
jgi:CHAT domain-containing protein